MYVPKEAWEKIAPSIVALLNPNYMVDKILKCRECGKPPAQITYEDVNMLGCCHGVPNHPQLEKTSYHPLFYQAINEWNRMQMRKGGE